MPEPEPAVVAQVDAHLALCPPCRVEQAALREVDRRVEQLGQHRLQRASLVLDAASRAIPEKLALHRAGDSLWRYTGITLIGFAILFLILLVFFHLR